ncbi:MAG: sulfatase-like hydrolase/transferase [Verrucomicrobiaceae bacterium]
MMQRPKKSLSTSFWQLVGWSGAVAAMLAAFANDWTLPLLGMDLRTRPGHLLIEAQEAIRAALIGSLIGGAWWACVCWGRVTGSLGIALWSLAAVMRWIDERVFWTGAACWLAWGLLAMVTRVDEWLPKAVKSLQKPRAWNGWFCLLWVIVSTGCDAALLREAPPGWIEAADCLLARFLTHTIIASGVWLLMAIHDRLAPALGRVIAWVIVLFMPLLIIVNTWLQLWWGKGMIEMFGELEVGGRFEVERAWAAGGVELNAQTISMALSALLIAPTVFMLCRWLSYRMHWRMSAMRLGVVAAVAWAVLQVDQLAGASLKDRGWCWWERKTYHRRMTWIEPPPGLEHYQAAFRNPKVPVKPQTLATKPDVFLFMVESLRDDTLTPQIAPFLTRFRDEECQPLGETWAASNVTHQSWFSVLSGRLPLFFVEGREEKQMLALPAVLKASGYRVEARMVNDFDYMDMVSVNFGLPTAADVMEHVPRHSSENFFKVPEREVRMLKRLKATVEGRPAGGLFAITGMDSTHYNYKWGAGFQPPFTDFEANPIFPMRPSAEQVKRIEHRFWNSVAWVDAQLAEFVGWLKQQGRYDDAIIIITGDHGEEFKEQGSWFHGTTLNRPQTRVPLLIKWPKSLSREQQPAHERASHLDLVPSLFDALGCEKELWQHLPGISLLQAAPTGRTIIMTTHFCGKNGEALLLKRGDVEAAFGWRDFWQPVIPSELWIERMNETSLSAWRDAFPDVVPKIFEKLEKR